MRGRDASAPLLGILRARIRAQGPISVGQYMAAALFEPGVGYYATKDPLGQAGDFITAPEISQIFGELIGLWSVSVWEAMGAPDPLLWIELGPGRGTLFADALRAVGQASPAFAAAVRLHLVEGSAPLRARQRQALARRVAAERIAWHDEFHQVPPGPALIIANEFVDALPVEQIVRTAEGWRERRIGVAEDGALMFTLGEPAAAAIPDDLADAREGSVFERCPAGEALASAIAARLTAAGGAALLIDYGDAPSGLGDTLQAVRGHRKWPVLAEPGTADLTHQVDFAALRRAAEAAGGRVYGPLPQGLFLGRLGIEARARALADDHREEDRVMAGVHRLIHPRRMGVLFKALSIADPALQPPPGF